MKLPNLYPGFFLALLLCVSVRAASDADPERWLYDHHAKPVMQVFSPDEYGGATQTWDMVQNAAGILYFANSAGILEYDGLNWRLIETGGPMRSLEIDDSGRIYAGGQRVFGYLEPDSLGLIQFNSLSDSLNALSEQTLTAWELENLEGSVYIRDSRVIIRYKPDSDSFSMMDAPEVNARFVRSGDRLYVLSMSDSRFGLYRIENEGVRFKYELTDRPMTMTATVHIGETDDYPLWLLQTDNEFTLYNPVTGERLRRVYPDGSASPYFTNPASRIYNAGVLSTGETGIVTIENGFYLFDKEFNTVYHFTEQSGLPSNTILNMAEDREGGIWLMTGNGIVRINHEQPARLIPRPDPIRGTPYVVHRYGNQLWILTSTSVMRAADKQIEELSSVLNQSRAFAQIRDENGSERLIILTQNGLASWDGEQLRESNDLRRNIQDFVLLFQPGRSDRFLLAGINHVTAMRLAFDADGTPRISEHAVLMEPGEDIHEGFVDAQGDVWLRTTQGFAYRLSSPQAWDGFYKDSPDILTETFDGTEDSPTLSAVFEIGNALFGIDDGHQLVMLDSERIQPGRPLTSEALIPTGLQLPDFAYLEHIETTENRVFMVSVDAQQHNSLLTFDGQTLRSDSLAFRQFTTEPVFGYHLTNDFAYASTPSGIWVTERHRLYTPGRADFDPVLVRSVHTGQDSLLFGGSSAGRLEPAVLDYSDHNLHFSYAQPSFSQTPQQLLFQSRLAGFNDQWSEWSDRTFREFSNLPEGDYVFEVRSRFPSGHVSPAGSYAFRILPPWYRTYWAYGLYLLGLILLMYGAVKWQTHRYKIRQQELEAVIEERTESLRQKNEDLESAKLEVESKNDEIAAVTELKDKLFANISHELRTPLTLVLGSLRNELERSPAPSSDLRTALNNSDRLKRLVEQIIDITRLDSGKVSLNRKPVETTSYFKTHIGAFESFAESRDVRLLVGVEAEMPVCLLDDDKIQMVIGNLLSNAIKFTDAHGEIQTEVIKEDDELIIRVSDTGKGIPESDIGNLFDRFYKVKQDEKNYSEGLGLGLAITKELVEMHGGTISVESCEGEGTTFIVRIPFIQTPAEPVEKTAQADPDLQVEEDTSELPEQNETKTAPDASTTKTAMVVDDNEDMKAYIVGIFRDAGYAVSSAVNGKDALKQLQSGELPDLVVSDIMMPELDGYGLAGAMKADKKLSSLPFIFVTARAEREDMMKALRIGINDYVVKPFDKKELLARAENLLEASRSRKSWAAEALVDTDTQGEDEQLIDRLREYVTSNISETDISVGDMAFELNMSERQLYRRVGELTGFTPAAFIREVRLQQAAHLLEQDNRALIKEVARQVGFRSASYFSKAYKKRFGAMPKSEG